MPMDVTSALEWNRGADQDRLTETRAMPPGSARPVPFAIERHCRVSPSATTRSAAVEDRVRLTSLFAVALVPDANVRVATTVVPLPACPLLTSDTVRLLVAAPVIAASGTYCTAVTVPAYGD